MTKQAPKILLDEDVQVLVAILLRAAGYEVETVSGLKRKGRSDDEQLAFASKNGFAILTFNRTDYENLAVEYFNEGKSHNGIIISVARPPHEVARRVIPALAKVSKAQIINQVLYL